MKKTGKYVNILFDEEALREINEFRFEYRFQTRAEAIRALIKLGLKSHELKRH